MFECGVDLQADLCVRQVKQFGCRSFSLLFDDIEREMCPADQKAFSSFAQAQAVVTNAVYQHLGEPETFLFCPTGGAASGCCPDNWSDGSSAGDPRSLLLWLMCVLFRSLQIIALRSALQRCPSRPTCRP